MRTSFSIRGAAAISCLPLTATGLLAIAANPAGAATAHCHLPVTPVNEHCYDILQGSGTTFYGMSGAWNRAKMTTPSSVSNQLFLDSEMWFGNSCGVNWVEEGLFEGYEPDIKKDAYEVFFGWQEGTAVPFAYQPIAYISPDATVTDNYQISRSSTTNKFDVWWDGNMYETPNVGFWSGGCLQLGAEVATEQGCANTFNMYSQAVNASSQFVNWGTQAISDADSSELYGHSGQNSELTWDTVVNNC